MKKKVVASLLCVAMGMTTIIGSTAVFAEEAEATEAEAEAEETEEAGDEAAAVDLEGVDLENTKIGISIYQFADNFMTLYRTELVRYLTEDLGFNADNIVVQDGKNDQAEQTNQINNFITDQVDVMILNLVQSSSAPQVTDMCNEAGIPVVFINRQPCHSR